MVQLGLEEDVTTSAKVRFVLIVNREHVLFQMRKLRESHTADGTFEGFFTRVLPDVQLEDA